MINDKKLVSLYQDIITTASEENLSPKAVIDKILFMEQARLGVSYSEENARRLISDAINSNVSILLKERAIIKDAERKVAAIIVDLEEQIKRRDNQETFVKRSMMWDYVAISGLAALALIMCTVVVAVSKKD